MAKKPIAKSSNKEQSLDFLILSRLDSFEASIRSLDTKVDDLVGVTIKQEANLKEHMKRSDLLEISQKAESAARVEVEKSIDARLKPVEKHVNFIDISVKLATALVMGTVAILGLVEGIAKLKSMFP